MGLIPACAPAILFRENGGPEVLELAEIPVTDPRPGEVLLRHTAIGVNFSDVNARRGGFYLQKPDEFPIVPGNEAVGQVVALGPRVTGVKLGDRMAYAGMGGAFFKNSGAYATYRAVPAARLRPVPDGVTDETAAAVLLKGLTASAALNRFHMPKQGETILVHAAASGVGLILAQWARHLGARVLGTVGSAEKAAILRENGIDAILYRETDFVAEVRRLCPEGVAAVYDGVGRDTIPASFDCLRPFGILVNYGNASGPPPAIDPMTLSAKGALAFARVGVGYHVENPQDFTRYTAELFDLCLKGAIRPLVRQVLPLAEAARAHELIETGRGAGSLVLRP